MGKLLISNNVSAVSDTAEIRLNTFHQQCSESYLPEELPKFFSFLRKGAFKCPLNKQGQV